jgi:hypothetical protein
VLAVLLLLFLLLLLLLMMLLLLLLLLLHLRLSAEYRQCVYVCGCQNQNDK